MRPPASWPDSLNGGRYQVRGLIARGGTAAVLRAWDQELGVERAIKLLDPGGNAQRMLVEARALAQVRHPHLVTVHDLGEQDGRWFVVMDYCPGGTLKQAFQQTPPPPLNDLLRWMEQVLLGLHAAHLRGIVHRDIKPSNLLLDAEGEAVIADFGVARWVDGLSAHTQTGVLVGSLATMAPEQRQDASRVGPACDLYAVGATLYTLATGRNPMDLFLADARHPRMEGLSAELRAFICRCTRLDPAERFPGAEQAADALADLRSRLGDPRRVPRRRAAPAPAPLPAAPVPPPPPGPGRQLGLGLLALGILALAGWALSTC